MKSTTIGLRPRVVLYAAHCKTLVKSFQTAVRGTPDARLTYGTDPIALLIPAH
jgi:hypothetical protein